MAKILGAIGPIAVLLGGCAGKVIGEQMPTYVGRPISAIIEKLGYPASQQSIAGAKVYVWETSRLLKGTSLQCKLRAVANEQEIVSTWDIEGDERGCTHYAFLLDHKWTNN